MSAPKPKILILGGLGFIGRHLVKYLVDGQHCSKIRIVDKSIPETASCPWSEQFMACLRDPCVERIQASLAQTAGIARAFGGDHFDYIVHLAVETRYGQTENVYKQFVLDVTQAVGAAAVEHHPQRFIFVSTAQVYDESRTPARENAKVKPWTMLSKFSLQAENVLKGMPLPLIIVRPAIVYGPADLAGLTPRLICGAIYKQLNERMEFLWTGELKMNTVHVRDVALGLWHLLLHGQLGETYNLADKHDTDQAKLNQIIEILFRIETSFVGNTKSNLARMNFKGAVETINDKHTQPWSQMLRAAHIDNSPLTPFLDQELLYNNHLCVDGSKIESTGFRYQCPALSPGLVKEVVDTYIAQGLFPAPPGWALPPGMAAPAPAPM